MDLMRILRDFYQIFINIVTNFKLQNDELISVGNVCLILDTSRDYFNYLHVNNPKAKEIVLEHMISYNIVDIYMYVHCI